MSDKPLEQQSEEMTGRSGQQRVSNGQETQAITIQAIASPQQTIDIILVNQRAIQELKKSMTYGVHYGPPYKNSKKDTLLKPGAEWTQKLFGIRPQYEKVESIIQPNFDDLSKSWIMFRYRCQMIEISSGLVVGEAIGTCHSLEDKYHWRNGQLQCPHCGQETLIISKKNENVWWCNKYNGGCGKETPKTAPEITSQQVGKVPNANPMDLANTLDKIAQKRAYVSAVLNATAASSIFAPGDDAIDDIDVSDIIEGVYTEASADPTPPQPKTTPDPEAEMAAVKYNLPVILDRVTPWYDHKNHAENSVNKLIREQIILDEDSDTMVMCKILEHRALSKPYNMPMPKVYEALTAAREAEGSAVPVASIKQWVSDGGTIEQAWQAIKDYHENANLEPAKAKEEPEAKDEAKEDIPF